MPLVANDKGEFKPFEFGNYPLLSNGKPKNGVFRLKLPSEADWTPRPKKKVEEEDEK